MTYHSEKILILGEDANSLPAEFSDDAIKAMGKNNLRSTDLEVTRKPQSVGKFRGRGQAGYLKY